MKKSSCFKILAKDKKTKARVGKLITKKGSIETPFFMPVATKTSVKHISSLDLEEMDCKAVISNTFILHLRPGEKLIKKLGGIGKFMNFKEINVTDKNGKTTKTEMVNVVENPANPNLVRRNVITKGAVVETKLGKARVTSRPGQEGVVNGILV